MPEYISDLGLSTSVTNALYRSEIRTTDKLVFLVKRGDLGGVKGLNKNDILEIEENLQIRRLIWLSDIKPSRV